MFEVVEDARLILCLMSCIRPFCQLFFEDKSVAKSYIDIALYCLRLKAETHWLVTKHRNVINAEKQTKTKLMLTMISLHAWQNQLSHTAVMSSMWHYSIVMLLTTETTKKTMNKHNCKLHKHYHTSCNCWYGIQVRPVMRSFYWEV